MALSVFCWRGHQSHEFNAGALRSEKPSILRRFLSHRDRCHLAFFPARLIKLIRSLRHVELPLPTHWVTDAARILCKQIKWFNLLSLSLTSKLESIRLAKLIFNYASPLFSFLAQSYSHFCCNKTFIEPAPF